MENAAPDIDVRQSHHIALILGTLCWLTCAVGLILMVHVGMATVWITGPILLVLSIALLVISRRGRFPHLWILGWINVGICLLSAGLAGLLSWLWFDLEIPFAFIAFVFTIGTLATLLWAISAVRKASPHIDRHQSHRLALILAILCWLTCAVGFILIVLVSVVTVVITGPILLLLSLPMLTTAWREKFPRPWILGCMNVGICLLFLALIGNFLGWGPQDLETPFAIIALVFTIGTLPLLVWAVRFKPQADPSTCRRCGYLLHGLSSYRCPECGTPFDPAVLNAHTNGLRG